MSLVMRLISFMMRKMQLEGDRRQDAIGTPYCITIDHQTIEDDSFTIRDRDSMEQRRINIEDLKSIVDKELTLKSLLKNL